jgi:shikimate kinase
MRIFLIGFMGSGKSHWGKLLAEKFRIPFFDMDHVITDAEKKRSHKFSWRWERNISALKRRKYFVPS